MKKILNNLLLVLKDKRSLLTMIVVFLLLSLIIYNFTDYHLIRGNLWVTRYYIWMIVDILFIILFSLFVAGFVYKSLLFWTHKNVWWRLGGFFGLLVTWCTSCSITLASYIWLAWLVSLLPWWGIELKIVWLLLVWYGVYNTYNKLTECEIKKK